MCPWAIVHLQKSQTLGTTSSKLWLFLVLQCFSLVSVKSKKGTQPRDHWSIHMLLKYVKLRSHCVENKAGKLTKAERQIDDLSSPAFDAAYDCEDIFAQSPHRWLPYLKLGMALRGQAMLPCGSHSFSTWPERYNVKIEWKGNMSHIRFCTGVVFFFWMQDIHNAPQISRKITTSNIFQHPSAWQNTSS